MIIIVKKYTGENKRHNENFLIQIAASPLESIHGRQRDAVLPELIGSVKSFSNVDSSKLINDKGNGQPIYQQRHSIVEL